MPCLPLPVLVLEETHTLDEILHLSDDEMKVTAHTGKSFKVNQSNKDIYLMQ